ncbi:hypothetical protein ACEPPN_016847 [Leptodophora sp. 'Broadleaf-Isolate-01']
MGQCEQGDLRARNGTGHAKQKQAVTNDPSPINSNGIRRWNKAEKVDQDLVAEQYDEPRPPPPESEEKPYDEPEPAYEETPYIEPEPEPPYEENIKRDKYSGNNYVL